MRLGFQPTQEELMIHESFATWSSISDIDMVIRAIHWLEKLRKQNNSMKVFPEPEFSKALAERLFWLCNSSAHNGIAVWRLFRDSSLSVAVKLTFRQGVKFFVKCLLHYSKQ